MAYANPLEIICHRVVWAVVLLAAVLALRGRLGQWRELGRRQFAGLALSGGLISINWLVFVWALLNDRMVEASLGYYINPLLSVLLGGLFFGEWLRPVQVAAVALAAVGVANELLAVGVVPWAGLTLATSFAFYGLVRKRLGVDAALGLGIETTLMLPLALAVLAWQTLDGVGTLVQGTPAQVALLAAGGAVTVFPLVCFAAAALRLPLAVLGLFQYLAPTMMLLLAVFVYGEPFRSSQLITFGCIWTALVIYSAEGWLMSRRLARQYPQVLTATGAVHDDATTGGTHDDGSGR